MSRFASQITDEYGRPVPGVSIYVYVWDQSALTAGVLETLTDDLSAPLSNPLISDATGEFYFNAANGQKLLEYRFGGVTRERDIVTVGPIPSGPPGGDGALFGLFTEAATKTAGTASLLASSGYSAVDKGAAVYVYDVAVNSAYVTANPRSSFITADARGFRLSLEQEINREMFGAVDDGTTDDSAATTAMRAFLVAHGITGYGYSTALPKAAAPFNVSYQGTTPTDLYGGGILEGEGGSIYSGGGSVLKYALNTTGLRVQYNNTTGETTYDASAGLNAVSASGTLIRNLTLEGSNSGSDATHPGIRVKAPCAIEDVLINGFAGDGITANCQISDTGAVHGNASLSQFWRFTVQNCLNGVTLQGADANICTVGFGVANSNRGYGFADYSELGNLWIGLQSAVNALGNYHTADDAAQAGSHPTLIHCYNESGSPASVFSPRTLRVGGSWNGDEVGGGYVYANSNAVHVNALVVDGALTAAGPTFTLGPQTGTSDATFNFMSMGASTTLNFWRNDFGVLDASIIGALNGLQYKATSFHQFYVNGSRVFYCDNGGLKLDTGMTVQINAVQVVGARDTGWSADTGTAKKTANATYAAGTTLTYSAAYVQSEQTAMATRMAAVEAALQNIAQAQKAIKDALIAHGLIGT